MAASEELLKAYLESLTARGYCPRLVGDLEAACVNAEAEMRRQRDRDLEDMEIAKLIPHGVDGCIERFGGSRRNHFYRADRGRELLREIMQTSATQAMGTCTES